MKFKSRIEVRPKSDLLDPEAETVKRSLVELGFCVERVSLAKVYEIVIEGESHREADTLVKKLCSRLLANPVKDDYTFRVEALGVKSA